MLNTTTATKKYVPVQDRAKLYAFGGTSPRARRFVASVRQLVHRHGATKLDTTPACLAVDEPLQLCASNNFFSESQKLEDGPTRTTSLHGTAPNNTNTSGDNHASHRAPSSDNTQ